MSSQDNDQDIRVVAAVLISAILLAVGLALGFGISKSRGQQAITAPAVASADANAPAGTDAAASATVAPAADAAVTAGTDAAAVTAAADADASVVVENGVVKFYFASGKSALAAGAAEALTDAITAGKAGKKLVVSGFHDASGDPAKNAELAKQRALAVRDALKAAGVADSAVELKKPEQATGSGNDAEARRVEVTIVP